MVRPQDSYSAFLVRGKGPPVATDTETSKHAVSSTDEEHDAYDGISEDSSEQNLRSFFQSTLAPAAKEARSEFIWENNTDIVQRLASNGTKIRPNSNAYRKLVDAIKYAYALSNDGMLLVPRILRLRFD